MNLVDVESIDVSSVGVFDFKRLGEEYLLANDFGDWLFLSEADFSAFLEGSLNTEGETYADLRQGNFLSAHLDENAAADKLRRRYRCLTAGPRTFQFALNRAAYEEADLDISVEEAVMANEVIERALDLAFLSTDQVLEIEIGGHAPLEAWDQLVHLVEYADTRNRLAMKDLKLTLVSDLAGIDEEKIQYLIKHQICLRARVSEEIVLKAEGETLDWLSQYNALVKDPANEFKGGAADIELFCSPRLFGGYEKVTGFVTQTGSRSVRLTTFDPNLITAEDDGTVETDLGSFLVFYGDVLDACLSASTEGEGAAEFSAASYLKRILDGEAGGGFELRNPTVDGVDRLAFSVGGLIFASDAGRIIHERRGDDIFLLGHVTQTGYRELVTHQTIRVLLIASVLECQPGWSNSPYKVFGGASPVRAYLEHGSVQGNMMDSQSIQEQVGILDCLFERLASANSEERARMRAMVDSVHSS